MSSTEDRSTFCHVYPSLSKQITKQNQTQTDKNKNKVKIFIVIAESSMKLHPNKCKQTSFIGSENCDCSRSFRKYCYF